MEPHTHPTSGTPAPYGQACVNCSRAKCKCITRTIGGSCERCYRLNKECHPAATTRKRHAKRSAGSKTAQLEEKLDGLVSLIKAATQSTPISIDNNATAAWDFAPEHNVRRNVASSSHSQAEGSMNGVSYDHLPDPTLLTPATTVSESTSCQSPLPAVPCVSDPSPKDAEKYLEIFRTQKSKYFPFIYIPPTTSAQQLLQERPFLWLCIMAVSSKSTSQQLALGSKIRQIVGQKMLLEFEKDLDLLLGLLAYIGWASYQVRDKPFLSVYTQLAMSLIFDLGLNKPLRKESHMALPFKANACPYPLSQSTVRTMEERRAVLGCFLVSSIISSFLQIIDALRWTPHMDECLQTLAEEQECPGDEVLVAQVRLQLIVEKAVQVPYHDREFDSSEFMRAPPTFYLKALQSQLQEVKRSLSPESQRNEVVLVHLYSTELTINEIALSNAPIISNNPEFQRLDTLYACLNSIKSWLDVALNIHPAAYIGFPFSMFSQFAHCLAGLYSLSTLDDPAWDKDAVRNTANPFLVLDQMINNLEQVPRLAGLENDSTEVDIFTKGVKTMRAIKRAWEAKLTVDPLGSTIATNQNKDAIVPDALPMDFFDDAWLTEALTSWDC